MTIAAWPAPKEASISFENVIFFSFEQFEFERGSPVGRLFEGVQQRYDVASLNSSQGFRDEQPGGLSNFGGFCLWKCDRPSPLLESLLDGNATYQALKTEVTLDHFMISCDELGSFHCVCQKVTVSSQALSRSESLH